MPIYEFYCADCHTVYNFFSRRIDTTTVPSCPGCEAGILKRQASIFAVSKGLQEESDALDDMDDQQMENLMSSMAGELENIDEDNPRDAARMIRRFFDATGLNLDGAMAEAVRRMESGEDPEQVEEDLGDQLEELDPFAAGGKKMIGDLRRRYLPPRVDKTLYDLHPVTESVDP